MMKLFAIIFLLLPMAVWACPNCHVGVNEDSRPPYTLMILGGFIILTYVPFYILFKAAKKYDPNENGIK